MTQKKQNKSQKKPTPKKDSVFAEAWENMNNDMARIMPAFLSNKLQAGKNKLWVMVVITLVELVVLGVIGKLFYDWLAG